MLYDNLVGWDGKVDGVQDGEDIGMPVADSRYYGAEVSTIF